VGGQAYLPGAGVSKHTVRRHLRPGGGGVPYRQPRRDPQLAGLEGGLKEHFHRHRGHAEGVRQALERVPGVGVSRRTGERALAGGRPELRAQARATVRFETPPGPPWQVDWGTATGEERGRANEGAPWGRPPRGRPPLWPSS
jgi:transposase